jgi:S-adenosylhomocysteine hydrolase
VIFKTHTKSKPASILGIVYFRYGTLGKSTLDKLDRNFDVMLLSKGTVIAKHGKINQSQLH